MGINFLCNIWKVEHGSAAFIKTPTGKCHLLDAGCSDSFSPAEYLQQQWMMSSSDCLIVSHPHNDHIQDLPKVMKELKPKMLMRNKKTPVELVYPSGVNELREPMLSWKSLCESYTSSVSPESSIVNAEAQGGVLFKFFGLGADDLSLSARGNINNYSLVTYVKYRGVEIIFPGDLEPDGWDTLIKKTEFSNFAGTGAHRFLVAPHHGRSSGIRYSDGSICKSLLDLVNPHIVVMSDKRGNDTTDPAAYRNSCLGMDVTIGEELVRKHVITTKTNECVSIQVEDNYIRVKLY